MELGTRGNGGLLSLGNVVLSCSLWEKHVSQPAQVFLRLFENARLSKEPLELDCERHRGREGLAYKAHSPTAMGTW